MYLGDALHMRYGDRGLNQIMNNRALGDTRVAEVRDRIAPIITQLVDNAKKQVTRATGPPGRRPRAPRPRELAPGPPPWKASPGSPSPAETASAPPSCSVPPPAACSYGTNPRCASNTAT